MKIDKTDLVKIIDRIIFAFIIIFLISLTNSIFVNQIGYFGALFFLLVKSFILRKNLFPRTGLEIALSLFIIAEVISTVLSVQPEESFRNLLKRFLLIPVFYSMIASTEDLRKGRLFLNTYLIAAAATILVYIFFSYEHFIAQLYQVELKGPSPFQYVMTAGGLISFTTVYFFAFFINEKAKIGLKILYLSAFLVSSLALFASFTRAAWLGTAAAIITILVVTKKWYLFLPIVIAAFLLVILFPKESQLRIYKFENDRLVLEEAIETEGKAYGIYKDSLFTLVSDFNNGLLIKKGNSFDKLDTDGLTSIAGKWKDNFYYAINSDTRIRVYERNKDHQLEFRSEMISPGRFYSFGVFNDWFMISDSDSGMTFFKDPLNGMDSIRIKGIKEIKSFVADSSVFAAYSTEEGKIIFWEMDTDLLPSNIIYSQKLATSKAYINKYRNNYYFFFDGGIKVYGLSENKITEIWRAEEPRGIINSMTHEDNVLLLNLEKKIFKCTFSPSGEISILSEIPLDYQPSGLSVFADSIYFTYNKSNRVLSIFDPYHLTNIERITQWRTGLRILMDHPLFGVGDIDLMGIYKSYKEYYEKINFGHLHNNFMHVLVILGLAGFAAFIYLLWRILKLNVKVYNSLKDRELYSSFALGTLASFVGFLFSGLAEWNFGDHEIITMVWFTLGLNFAFYKLSEKKKIEAEG